LCRSVDEAYLDRVRAYQPTEPYKKALRKRSVWVEPLFAEGKDWHGMRRLRLRELERVNCEALMRAAGQNLKRLLKKRGWRHRPGPAQALSAFFLASLGWFARTLCRSGLFYWPIGSDFSRAMNHNASLLMDEFLTAFFNRLKKCKTQDGFLKLEV
jgi:hypothetical protein